MLMVAWFSDASRPSQRTHHSTGNDILATGVTDFPEPTCQPLHVSTSAEHCRIVSERKKAAN